MVVIPGYKTHKLIYTDKTYAMYRGIREEDNQSVILKSYHMGGSSSIIFNQSQHEYNVMQTLKGEGIARALDLITVQDKIILIYEDIGAGFFDNFLKKKTLSIGEGLAIAIKITAALERVHRAGFIHKRINPNNILYEPESRKILLINFELATEMITDQMFSNGSEVNQLSMAYIAPEQTGKINRSIGYASDLYSLGAVFYRLFCGQLIFQTNDILEYIHSHIAIIPEPPHRVNPVFRNPWQIYHEVVV